MKSVLGPAAESSVPSTSASLTNTARLEEDDLIILGRIISPYGLRGWLNVHFFGDDPLALGKMPQWWLGKDPNRLSPDESRWRTYAVQQLKPHGKSMIAKLEGVDDRTAAEAIDGNYLAAPREALPKTEKDEYYWADLIGLTVENTQGIGLGKLIQLMTAGAHEVLCIKDEAGQERLLPFVSAVVKQVDVNAGKMLVEWGEDW